jgi:myo-inositol-1(or 4)-monophosphatase
MTAPSLDAPDARAALLFRLADLSGAVIRRWYREPLPVERKGDDSPVTLADREAELAMREAIERAFPDDGILGEEHGAKEPAGADGWVWVLDPIDGTVSFTLGWPLFGTLVALCRRDPANEHGRRRGEGAVGGGSSPLRPVLGLIHQPITGDLLVGDGARALLNGRPVRVRGADTLAEAKLLTSDHRLCERHFGRERWSALLARPRVYRACGDCQAYAQLALGFCDAVIDSPMRPWDYLPLVPVIEGAGGRITDEEGGPPREGSAVIASAGPLHEALLAALAGRA